MKLPKERLSADYDTSILTELYGDAAHSPWRRGISQLRHEARRVLVKLPVLYLPLTRWKYPPGVLHRPEALHRNTELVIEVYPRSGNSFAYTAFDIAQGETPVRVSHHLHTASPVIAALKAKIPCVILVRHPEDAIISDALNHASIIDGVRLCKAMRYRYQHNDMEDLEKQLQNADTAGARQKIIVTDGVFSMDGTIAQLDKICDLADKYNALVMSDECHSTGFMGKTGRGIHEHCGVMDRVDIITGTLGKALGGASGGFTSGKKEIIELLRQRSRPYLFSNTLAPSITGASITVIDMLSETTELRDKLEENTRYFRSKMMEAGFDIKPGEHAIVPIMLYDAPLSQKFADALLEKEVYVIGFFYPVVPKCQARIRVQISAAHERSHLDAAIAAFISVGKDLGVI